MIKKILNKKLTLIQYCFTISIVLQLFLNHFSFVYISKYRLFPYGMQAIIGWSCMTFLFLLCFTWNKILLKISAIFAFIMLIIYNGYAYLSVAKWKLNELTLAVILDTNYREGSELLNSLSYQFKDFILKYSIIPLMLIIFLPIRNYSKIEKNKIKMEYKIIKKYITNIFSKYILKYIKKYVINNLLLIKKHFKLLFLFLFVLCILVSIREQILIEHPLFSMFNISGKLIKNRYGFFNQNSKEYYKASRDSDKDNDLIVVLFFGEAARADRWSLNGYSRDTNPLLSKQKNLINFNNAHSCRVSTSLSFNCVMTGNNPREFSNYKKQQTIYSFFKQTGFNTAFLSTGANDLNEYISKDLNNVYLDMNKYTFINDYTKTYDYDLVNMLQKFLEKNKNNSVFATMIGMGSHYDYKNRVPKEFHKFKTTDEEINNKIINLNGKYCFILNGKSLGKINDDYDATILYTDYVLNSIIETLKDKNAIFLYASDHGESFGERGNGCLHAYYANDPEIWNIPFFIWVSNKFIEKNPEKWKNIQLFKKQVDNQERFVSHDNIIHTLLDCSSIKSDFIDKRFSMCNQDGEIYRNEFEELKRFEK